MRSFVWRLLINVLSLFAIATILSGVHVSGFWSALTAAAVLGLLNAIIRPLLLLFSLPLNLITLGLFTFVINGMVLWMAQALVPGFAIDGFWYSVLAALLLSLISSFLSWLINEPKAY